MGRSLNTRASGTVTGGRPIALSHGNGGRYTRELVERVFARHFGDGLDTDVDAAVFELDAGSWAMTMDGFTVDPLEFPGGNIGDLAAHGTINDLAVAGAEIERLTVSAIIEEGLPEALLDRCTHSLAEAARAAGARVVAGDTKVVPRGRGGGLYLTTTGLGRVRRRGLCVGGARVGDCLLVSGTVGDHGVSVMLAREDFELRGDLRSDCASVLDLCRAAWTLDGVRFLRDPTRGGLATVANDIARAVDHTVELTERSVPVRGPVRTVCNMLGYDPYYLACEGRVVAAVAEDQAEALLDVWQHLPGGRDAAVIGHVRSGPPRVELLTSMGGGRVIEPLEDDPLPRIC